MRDKDGELTTTGFLILSLIPIALMLFLLIEWLK
jgi:hypothetical protein